MLNKQDMEKKVKEMAQAKCAYPGCKEKQMMTCSLQIIALTESGKIITPYTRKDSQMSMGVPLCAYHFRISTFGLLAVMEKRNKYLLHGPFDVIRIAEAVYDAKEFAKEIIKEPGVKK